MCVCVCVCVYVWYVYVSTCVFGVHDVTCYLVIEDRSCISLLINIGENVNDQKSYMMPYRSD